MRIRRKTYAAGPRNDEIQKISLEIKQVIKQLQDEALKKDKLQHEHVKIIHGLKREYQNLKAEKNRLLEEAR